MPRYATDTPSPDRLLTPLGGMALALTLSVATFWLPLLELLH